MAGSGGSKALRTTIAAGLLAGALAGAIVAGAQPRAVSARNAPNGTLAPFQSNAELRAYLRRQRRELEPPPPPPPPPAAAAAAVTGEVLRDLPGAIAEQEIELQQANVPEGFLADGTAAGAPGITNNQEAAVDEGGIVKIFGNILVILRRGRLFTVSLANGGLQAIDHINAFPPGASGAGAWYDEMLIAGDRVVVIGYSYERGGTEINRFRLSPEGRLRWEDSYHLRSNDYYSSRNYASRLIGNRLIIYTPLYLEWESDPLEAMPGIRRWREGGEDGPFQRIAGARQIYKPPLRLRRRGIETDTLHTVMDCNIAAPVLDCSATGVLGTESRTFYVSGNAVYLWTSDWQDDSDAVAAFLYRLPLSRQRPAAIAVRGAPVDQFSFREDAGDGLINVVVRSEGGGDAMWRPEVSDGDIALLRLPIRDFGDGSGEARLSRYRPLPKIAASEWNFHNRFIGGNLLYGGGEISGRPDGGGLVVVPLAGGPAAELELAHGVDRIEALGRDGLVVGGGAGALGFTAIELDGRAPRVGDLFRLPDAAEGETRSHAFFFSPETADGRSGMLGLPIAREVEPAYHRFFGSAAAMLFLRRDNRRFAPAGELGAEVRGVADDGCEASCVDWYGNARPIFLGERVFALLGYELVEGRRAEGMIRERRRLNFAPRQTPGRE